MSLSLSTDGLHVVINDSLNGGFSMNNLKNGEMVRRFDNGTACVTSPVSFIHDGRALMTAESNGVVQLWDVQDGIVFGSLEHCPGCEP